MTRHQAHPDSRSNLAVRWRGPESLTVERVPFPAGEPDEVVVKVESAGVCGTDVSAWRGDVARIGDGTVIGHEFGGTIVEVGDGVDRWGVGQRVAIDPNDVCDRCDSCRTGSLGFCTQRRLMGIDLDGGMREYVAVRSQRLVPVGGNTDPLALALVEPVAVAVRACGRARTVPGTHVGVIGGGSIGTACVLHARDLGVRSLTVVESDPARRAIAAAHDVAAIAPGDRPSSPFDSVIDTVGTSTTIGSSVDLVRTGGTVCVVGVAHDGSLPFAEKIVRDEITLTGSFCYSRRDLHQAADLVGRVDLSAFAVDVVDGLAAVPAVFTSLGNGIRGPGKAVVIP